MKILRYLRRTTSLVLILLLLLTTFGGCITVANDRPIYFADHEEGFYGELAKISKEVEGYALVETEEKQDWMDRVITQKNGKECELFADEGLVYIKNDESIGGGTMINVGDYFGKSEALGKIDNIEDRLENNRGWQTFITLHGIKIFNEKVFILASCSLSFNGFIPPGVKAKSWRAPILFEYNIEQDALRYAGYKEKGIRYSGESIREYTFMLDIIKL